MASLGRTKIPVKKLNKVTPATVKSKRLCSKAVILATGSKRMVAIETVPLTPEKVKRVAPFQIFFSDRLALQALWANTALIITKRMPNMVAVKRTIARSIQRLS